MSKLNRALLALVFVYLPSAGTSEEGYSSSEPSKPANIHQRAFTIYTGQTACEKSPEIASIKLILPSNTMYIGERLHTTGLNNSRASDLIIEAFDAAGNFVSSVPVYVTAYSTERTISSNPGIIHRDASIEYWEATRIGSFDVFVRWLCDDSRNAKVFDKVRVEVIANERSH